MDTRYSLQRFPEFAYAVSQVPHDVVIKIVCEEYGVERHSLLNRSRIKELVEVRQVAMYILSMSIARSYNKIGMLFYRDHATVMYSCETIDGYMITNHRLRRRVIKIIGKVAGINGKTCQLVGPISGVPEYERNFNDAEQIVRGLGHLVINPTDIVCKNDDYKRAMNICLNSLFNVASIALLPGWQSSPGAQAEYHLAKALNLQIIEL